MKRFQLLGLLPSILVIVLHQPTPANASHVLVIPGEFSHWLNMRNIMEELVRRNHSVTVLVPDASPSVNYNSSRDAAKFNFLVYKVSFSREEIRKFFGEFIHTFINELPRASVLNKVLTIRNVFGRSIDFGMRQCNDMMKNEQLMATLWKGRFHAVLLDPMTMCGDLVADVLNLPLIVSLRFSFGSVMERHCGHAVAPPSFVPTAPLLYSDHMTFRERVINLVTYVASSVVTEWLWKTKLDQFYSEMKGSPTTVCDTLRKADIWLIRTFWDIETPRPVPPNFKYVGGLHCQPAYKLPDDLEAFVESSGDAGVVVVSFGSMVTHLSAERANVIATALGRIPQKVIWRLNHEPKTLAPNTKVFDWIPQNDLLGHPRTRAFITHGGTNGLYEAVYHAVPLVGLPLFADQHDNLERLSRRGAAIVLDLHSMTLEELTEALNAVITQPSYKASMQHLSVLHHERPVSALDTAVFWVEFVMRHGGARHLRLGSQDLNWFQYHSLDVVSFLLALMIASCAICWATVRCFLRSCRRRRREKKD